MRIIKKELSDSLRFFCENLTKQASARFLTRAHSYTRICVADIFFNRKGRKGSTQRAQRKQFVIRNSIVSYVSIVVKKMK